MTIGTGLSYPQPAAGPPDLFPADSRLPSALQVLSEVLSLDRKTAAYLFSLSILTLDLDFAIRVHDYPVHYG
jgi:hypothetical protein